MVDSRSRFLELGFDSLFLTQVTQALQTKFGLKITFRQLLGDQSTLDDLTAYIDSKLPASAFAAPAASSAASNQRQQQSAARRSPALSRRLQYESRGRCIGISVERLMREQLQAMNQLFAQQLAALQNQAIDLAATTTAAPPPVAAASCDANR